MLTTENEQTAPSIRPHRATAEKRGTATVCPAHRPCDRLPFLLGKWCVNPEHGESACCSSVSILLKGQEFRCTESRGAAEL